MTNEQFLPVPKPEAPAEAQDDFERSSHELFSLLEQTPPVEDKMPVFYQARWDAEQPQQLTEIVTMTLTPTGARRQEHPRGFSQAQYKTHEVSNVEKESRQRFIWCYTGPQPLAVVAPPEPRAMKAAFGFQPLEPQAIIATVAERAETPRDYALLLRRMARNNLDISSGLALKVNRVVYGLIDEELASSSQGVSETVYLYRKEIFELLSLLGQVDTEASITLRSRMVSRLLLGMQGRWGVYGEANPHAKRQLSAAQTLEAAVTQGFIPPTSTIRDRILGYPTVYRHAFGIDLLHADLSTKPFNYGSINILGINREVFVHDFMMFVLDGRLRAQDRQDSEEVHQLKVVLASTSPARNTIPPVSFHGLLNAASILDSLGTEAYESTANKKAPRANIKDLSRVFGRVLDALLPDDPEAAQAQKILNQKSVEIVETILYPLVLQIIAHRAVKNTVAYSLGLT